MCSNCVCVCVSGLQVSEDRWRGETLLQSTFTSKLLTLGQVASSASAPGTPEPPPRSQSAACSAEAPPPSL